jgi:hypothetical protein
MEFITTADIPVMWVGSTGVSALRYAHNCGKYICNNKAVTMCLYICSESTKQIVVLFDI